MAAAAVTFVTMLFFRESYQTRFGGAPGAAAGAVAGRG
jgi:hypothetical protein